MRPATSSVRHALLDAINAGACGTYAALARVAGVPAQQARATLKELRRGGHCEPHGRAGSAAGRAAPAVYGARRGSPSCDALAHVRAAWR